MKRKYMIAVLQKAFLEHMNCHNCCMNDEEMYSKILQSLEEAGMQPPAYFNVDYYDEPECDGMMSEWEPDDLHATDPEEGPDTSDCPARVTDKVRDCAQTGCGFCTAQVNYLKSQCNCDNCQSSLDTTKKD